MRPARFAAHVLDKTTDSIIWPVCFTAYFFVAAQDSFTSSDIDEKRWKGKRERTRISEGNEEARQPITFSRAVVSSPFVCRLFPSPVQKRRERKRRSRRGERKPRRSRPRKNIHSRLSAP